MGRYGYASKSYTGNNSVPPSVATLPSGEYYVNEDGVPYTYEDKFLVGSGGSEVAYATDVEGDFYVDDAGTFFVMGMD